MSDKEGEKIISTVESKASALEGIKNIDSDFWKKACEENAMSVENIGNNVARMINNNSTSEENSRKLDQLFNKMIGNLHKQREEAKRCVRSVPHHQQSQFMEFVNGFCIFFKELATTLLKWLIQILEICVAIETIFRVIKKIAFIIRKLPLKF